MAINIPQKGGGSNAPLAQQLQGYSAGSVLVPAGDAYDQGNNVYMMQNTSQGRTDEMRPVAYTMAPAPTPAASSGGPVDLSSALAAIANQGGMTRDAMGRGFADQMSGIEGQHGQTRGAISQGFADQLSQMLGQFDQSRNAMTGAFDTQGQLIRDQGQQTRDAMGTGFGTQLEGIERLFNQYGSLGGLGGIKTPSAVYRPAGDPNTVNGAQGTNQSIWGSTNPFNATF